MIRTVKALSSPIANFFVHLNGLAATFNNNSQNAHSYLWDFGDGNSSTQANPVHMYTTPGAYSVQLSAANQCATASKTHVVPITVGAFDLSEQFGIRILPNPTEGDFWVEIESRTDGGDVRLSLLDMQGQLLKEIEISIDQALTTILFDGLQLPKGVYQLNVQTEKGWRAFPIVVQ